MGRIVHVIRVKPLGDYRLRLEFSDGAEGEHDFAALIDRPGPMVEPLRDPSFFARVFLEDGALTWPNHFDLDPTALHMRMTEAGELRGVDAAE